jgi:hypothetical protein
MCGNKRVAIIVYISKDFCLSTIPIIIIIVIIKECGLSTILIILKFLPKLFNWSPAFDRD